MGKSFIAGLGMQIASGAISTGQNLLSNALGLTMSQKKAMEEQYKYNKQIMALQNQYQKEAAEKSQEYAKEYWDYTNVENQKKHLKEAGLNPALIYGQSGAGGMGATGGAKQESPNMPMGNPIEMGLRIQEMNQTRRLQDAQIAETYAKAAEAEANAKKTAGVDTDLVMQMINESIEKTNTLAKQGKWYEAQSDLIDVQEEVARKTIKNVEADTWLKTTQANTEEERKNLIRVQAQKEFADSIRILEQAANLKADTEGKKINNRIQAATMEEQIRAVALNNAATIAGIAVSESQVKVNEKTIEKMGAEMYELFERGKKHKMDAESFRKEVEGQLKRWDQQNFNEKWHMTNETAKTIIDPYVKVLDIIVPW